MGLDAEEEYGAVGYNSKPSNTSSAFYGKASDEGLLACLVSCVGGELEILQYHFPSTPLEVS